MKHKRLAEIPVIGNIRPPILPLYSTHGPARSANFSALLKKPRNTGLSGSAGVSLVLTAVVTGDDPRLTPREPKRKLRFSDPCSKSRLATMPVPMATPPLALELLTSLISEGWAII